MTRGRLIFLCGALAAALAGCGGDDGDSDGADPLVTMNGFIETLADGSAEACDQLTEKAQSPGAVPGTDGYAPDVPCEDWVGSLPEDAREMLSSATVVLLEETDDYALVQVSPQTADPPIVVPLVKDGDEWRIDWGGEIRDL